MRDKILRFLRSRSTNNSKLDAEQEEAMMQTFHGLPDPLERAQMSPERLAILLSEQQTGTPAYILIEHELDLRITSVQSNATIRSARLGLIGTLLGTVIGWFLGTLSPKAEQSLREQVLRCECVSQAQQPSSGLKLQVRSSTVPSTISADGKPAGTKVKNEKADGNVK
ncbi:hypothetical protein ACYX34_11945 [Nitrospira sp. CMX1]